MFQRYYGDKQDYTLGIVSNVTTNSKSDSDTAVEIGSGVGNARGELYTLKESSEVDSSYLDSAYFVIDSTFFNLAASTKIDANHIWGTTSGSLPISSVNDEGIIKFPNDGSSISIAQAAMIIKPDKLYICIGTDGLAKVSQDQYILLYNTLISNIRSASPDTRIIVSALPGVVESYSNVDNLNVTSISDGNDWIQLVCRDTGAYYLDIREALQESASLLTKYADSNGKTLNSYGLDEFLTYIKTHSVQ